MLQLVLLSLVLLLFIWLLPSLKVKARAYLALSSWPRPPDANLLGHMKYFNGKKSFNLLCKFILENGGVCGLRVLDTSFVVIADPVVANEVLQINDASDKGLMYQPFEAITTKPVPSVFSTPTNTYWRGVRKGVSPAFNGGNLRQGFSRLSDLMPAVLKHVNQAGPEKGVNVDSIAGRVTMDAISLAIFGKTMGCCDDLAQENRPRLAQLTADAMAIIIATFPAPWVLNLTFIPAVKRARDTLEELRALHRELLHDLRTCNPPDSSLGAHLLALKDAQTGQPLNDHQLEAEMAIFILAGFETSLNTITWVLNAIATHPEVQKRVAEELKHHGLLASQAQPTPRPLEWEDLGKLEYLRIVIKETMRLWPTASNGTGRSLKKDIKLGTHTVPAGTQVQVNFYSLHRNPAYWDRATEFIPERWNVPNAEYVQSGTSGVYPADASRPDSTASNKGGPRPSDGISAEELWKSDAKLAGGQADRSHIRRYMPFSVGLRNCVGQNLANTTVLTFVATICSQFAVSLAPEMGGVEGVQQKTSLTLTLHVDDGLRLRFKPHAQI